MEIIRHSLRSLFRKKVRTILTIAGVAIGVFSVVLIASIGDVGKSAINSELDSIGINGVMIGTDETKTDQKMDAEQLKLIAQDEQVSESMPLMIRYTSAMVHSHTEQSMVFGVDPNATSMISMKLIHGRLINERDMRESERICVVDESYALSTYSRSNIVGKTVTLDINGLNQEFEIIGVVESGGSLVQSLMGEYIPCFLYVPNSTLQNEFGSQAYDQVMVKFNTESADLTQLEKQLNESFGVKDAVSIQNLVQQKEQFNEILDMVTGILALIAGISLLVSGISIMTVMLTSVQERTKEIGIKKAIGASQRRILIEFLTESFFICLFGSLIGIAIGVGCAAGGCALLGIPFSVSWKLFAGCGLFSILVGILFGVYPAQKAARLKPVDALRSEQ